MPFIIKTKERYVQLNPKQACTHILAYERSEATKFTFKDVANKWASKNLKEKYDIIRVTS